MPSTSSSIRPSVLFVQRILAPYRLALFQGLARSGEFSATFAYGEAPPQSALESIADPPGLTVLPLRNHFFGAHETVIVQRGLSHLIASMRYRIVVAEFNPRIVSNLLAFFQARRRGIRFVWWGHGFRPRSGAIARQIYLWLAARADAIIFYDAQGAEKFVASGMPRDKLFVAWNSIDTQSIDQLLRPWVTEERPNIVCIGRLIPEKKVDLLIQGFAQACPQLNPATKLVLIGDGPTRASLEELVRQNRIEDRVVFVGSVYEEENLAPWFNSAWLSISPGYIGLSAIHSLAFGVPMLVADKEPHSPEIAAIEAGTNSQFFQANNAEDLARNLVELSREPSRLERMSAAALKTVRERFSTGSMIRTFEAALRFANRDS